MTQATHESIAKSVQTLEVKISERQKQTDARDARLDGIIDVLRKDVDNIKLTIAKMAGGGKVLAILLSLLMTIIAGVVTGILVKLW